MNIHYHTILRQLAGSPTGLFTLFPTHTDPGRRDRGPGVSALQCAVRQKKTSISRSAAFKLVRVTALRRGDFVAPDPWADLHLAVTKTDYAIRPSWTPLCRGVNNWRNNAAKSWRLIGCAPGHQVTPRLCALFHAGASGDSLPSHAFPTQERQVTSRLRTLFLTGSSGDSSPSRAFLHRGMRWLLCTARVPYHLEWECPSTHGSRWCATWEPLAPVSALGSPHRHERGMWEAGLMSCPAGSTVERNADIVGISSSPESLRSTTDRGQTDSS